MLLFYWHRQGMEDVLVLEDMLKQHPGDRRKAFEAYSLHRQPDAHAIVDLAMYNYIEVSSRFTMAQLLQLLGALS